MSKTRYFTAPNNIAMRDRSKPSIFLAGSIEMGTAENWQEKVGNFLLATEKWNVFDPRRKDWDSSWIQSYSNPQFSQQVHWEINALEKADLIIMYLDPATKSPISLLELGLFAGQKKNMKVVCPDGFWRKGNVEVVCSLYDVPLFNSLEELYKELV
jgi:nucleoside 2-deoxyribosyltransferase